MPPMSEPELLSEIALRAMILASIADGRRVDDEDRVAIRIYEEAAGAWLAPSAYDALCAEIGRDPESAWRWIEERVPALAQAPREEIARAVIRVVIADAELVDAELGLFRRLAGTLRIPTRRFRELMNEVWRGSRGA
jgi:hypothetical protein